MTDYRKRVLDMGAGSMPDLRATHAIDKEKKRSSLFKNQMKFGISQLKPVGLTDYDIAIHHELKKDIDYTYGIDFNKDPLPYPDQTFTLVISNCSAALKLLTPSTLAFKEAYRVLKPNGQIEINVGGFNTNAQKEREVKKLFSHLSNAGFKNIQGKQKHLTNGFSTFVHPYSQGYSITGKKPARLGEEN